MSFIFEGYCDKCHEISFTYLGTFNHEYIYELTKYIIEYEQIQCNTCFNIDKYEINRQEICMIENLDISSRN